MNSLVCYSESYIGSGRYSWGEAYDVSGWSLIRIDDKDIFVLVVNCSAYEGYTEITYDSSVQLVFERDILVVDSTSSRYVVDYLNSNNITPQTVQSSGGSDGFFEGALLGGLLF